MLERRAREGAARRVGLEQGSKQAAEAEGPQLLGHVERVLVHERVLAPDRHRLEVRQQRDGDGLEHHLLVLVVEVLGIVASQPGLLAVGRHVSLDTYLAERDALAVEVVLDSRVLELVEARRHLLVDGELIVGIMHAEQVVHHQTESKQGKARTSPMTSIFLPLLTRE